MGYQLVHLHIRGYGVLPWPRGRVQDSFFDICRYTYNRIAALMLPGDVLAIAQLDEVWLQPSGVISNGTPLTMVDQVEEQVVQNITQPRNATLLILGLHPVEYVDPVESPEEADQ